MGELKLNISGETYYKRVRLIGFNELQREQHLSEYKEKLGANGWILLSVEKKGFLEYYAIFSRDQAPSTLEKYSWFLSEHQFLVFCGLILFVGLSIVTLYSPRFGVPLILSIIFGCLSVFKKKKVFKTLGMLSVSSLVFVVILIASEQEQKDIAARNNARNSSLLAEQQRAERANNVANKLLVLLRDHGIGSELVVDVKADQVGNVYVVVSNGWLSLPHYVQKQNKQIVQKLTTVVSPPRGHDLVYVDIMGNKY